MRRALDAMTLHTLNVEDGRIADKEFPRRAAARDGESVHRRR
jgi:hypothetical protein